MLPCAMLSAMVHCRERMLLQQLNPSITDDLTRQQAQSVKAGFAAALAVALTDEHAAARFVPNRRLTIITVDRLALRFAPLAVRDDKSRSCAKSQSRYPPSTPRHPPWCTPVRGASPCAPPPDCGAC